MPLETNILYGLMTGSAIVHIVIPIAAFMIVSAMPSIPYSPLLYVGLCVSVSFLAQTVFLTIMQTTVCDGVKQFFGIVKGAGIAAIITGCIIAIPVFVEPMRLMVSQLFTKHIALLPPDIQRIHALVAGAVKNIIPSTTSIVENEPISKEAFAEQTLRETMFGACFWSAFAGAYGVAFGSLTAASCPAPAAGASGP